MLAAGSGVALVVRFSAAIAAIYVISCSQHLTADNLRNAVILNVVLAVFNLFPLPPLDGGRILGRHSSKACCYGRCASGAPRFGDSNRPPNHLADVGRTIGGQPQFHLRYACDCYAHYHQRHYLHHRKQLAQQWQANVKLWNDLRGWAGANAAALRLCSSVGGSVKATIDRVIGTIGGAVAGGAVGYIVPHQSVFSLGVALVIALAPLTLVAALWPSYRIAPLTAVIVLLTPGAQQLGPVDSAIYRIVEITLGSFCRPRRLTCVVAGACAWASNQHRCPRTQPPRRSAW